MLVAGAFVHLEGVQWPTGKPPHRLQKHQSLARFGSTPPQGRYFSLFGFGELLFFGNVWIGMILKILLFIVHYSLRGLSLPNIARGEVFVGFGVNPGAFRRGSHSSRRRGGGRRRGLRSPLTTGLCRRRRKLWPCFCRRQKSSARSRTTCRWLKIRICIKFGFPWQCQWCWWWCWLLMSMMVQNLCLNTWCARRLKNVCLPKSTVERRETLVGNSLHIAQLHFSYDHEFLSSIVLVFW